MILICHILLQREGLKKSLNILIYIIYETLLHHDICVSFRYKQYYPFFRIDSMPSQVHKVSVGSVLEPRRHELEATKGARSCTRSGDVTRDNVRVLSLPIRLMTVVIEAQADIGERRHGLRGDKAPSSDRGDVGGKIFQDSKGHLSLPLPLLTNP